MAQAPLHLAAALDGAGWHPAAWRDPGARPRELLTAGYWTDLVLEAERGLLDFVTIEDALGPGDPVGRTDRVRGRLDAVLVASRVAPLTRHIGLVPTATTTHTEPFHVATALATLDHISAGRAGWRARISGRREEAAHFGRREFPEPDGLGHIEELFGEATDVVEVVRRLWDSWEDDAVIRHVASGRFVDRDKLHYVDFAGRWFSVKGPLITPRPPQGQLLVTALAHAALPYRFAAGGADLVYVTPRDGEQARSIVAEVREAEAAVRREEPLKIFADLLVFLDASDEEAADRKARLDDLDGAGLSSDAAIFTGTPEGLADLILDWRTTGLDGYRLRPGTLPHDLEAISRAVVPVLQERGAFRREYEAGTLRGLLGLARPVNRHALERR
ncbi:LLM class flavin-dependent oxidoreductase [Actinoallomurus bryophytorum]|uniref:Alkanesulfonate monooxygenase SsuD/methylene tetrahydromethanopterin reductase-like flavin-dependent oxidoreductase (Luciferase family) n=1 Tax=Actinoallomurus bryophytorum TaxID=1490222 RepID=A0A543CTT4_9ACTN|nr:LLM class flavin-dependent oxidoreductase [Actinoallomurus bryophytorum]TQM00516.1 alkanesulfonate monooxygenase SsuD/methylene tetrahydromethanopterin reductase-like flavin-dependent oxidoreductase (luciferase family) [Actinoallomurus bryophytorum]